MINLLIIVLRAVVAVANAVIAILIIPETYLRAEGHRLLPFNNLRTDYFLYFQSLFL